MENSSKIYVAGHQGLVGSAIWENLQSKGYNNLIGKSSHELNLLNQTETEHFFKQEKPEYVFLTAAKVGGIIANNTFRGEFIYENLTIQNNVIHNAWKHGAKKLLFLGSTCIYPMQAPQPMKENFLLTSPLEYINEPYAVAKIAGIKLCENYNLQYGTNFIAAVPANLYGPNDNFDLEKSHVLPALIRKIHLGKCLKENNWHDIRKDLNSRPIENISGNNDKEEISQLLKKYGIFPAMEDEDVIVEIWGTGKPQREFLWSEELADACVYLMENTNFEDIIAAMQENSKHEIKEIRNTHINIGTGKDISIKNLAKLISEIVGFEGELDFNEDKPDGTFRKLTDVSKLHELGWQHKIEIEEGVKKLYEWYINQLNNQQQ